MSKKLSYVSLDRMDLVRLNCKAPLCSSAGNAVEVSLARLWKENRDVRCAGSGAVLRAAALPGQADAFAQLAQAVEDLKKFALLEHLGVEFVIRLE